MTNREIACYLKSNAGSTPTNFLASSDFEQGGISTEGSLYNISTRIRSKDYQVYANKRTITIAILADKYADFLQYSLQFYTENKQSGSSYEGSWMTSCNSYTVDIPADAAYFKLSIRYKDNDSITPDSINGVMIL